MELSQESNTKITVGIDVSQISLTETIIQINNLHKIFGINAFKLNGLPFDFDKQQTMITYMYKNITNDITLIFDDIIQATDTAKYNNIVCLSEAVSDGTVNQGHLKIDLSSIEDMNDYLINLSRNNKLTTLRKT